MKELDYWSEIKKEFLETKDLYYGINTDFDKENNDKRWNEMKKLVRAKGRDLIANWENYVYDIKKSKLDTFEEMMGSRFTF